MITKEQIPENLRGIYDYNRTILTEEAFTIWCENAVNFGKSEPKPLPANCIRKTNSSSVSELAKQARDAVSGYSDSNNLRKAVEALADALESRE